MDARPARKTPIALSESCLKMILAAAIRARDKPVIALAPASRCRARFWNWRELQTFLTNRLHSLADMGTAVPP